MDHHDRIPTWFRHVHDAVTRLLFDRNYFWHLAALVIVGDVVLTQLIIGFVSFTEIDWETYMIQARIADKGELNYANITGPTGPAVYPAGHLYIHRLLYHLTQGGENVKFAQYLYGVLYISLLSITVGIYRRAASTPNWLILLFPLSKRLHSIFVLRLFNDCWSVLAVHAAILAYQTRGRESLAGTLFSVALSVKMSALLYLPGILLVLFKRVGPLRTALHLALIVAIQVFIGLPYLIANPKQYLHASFDFSRVFLYKWTVNWRLVDEEVFLSPNWAKCLVLGHAAALVLFATFRWCGGVDGVFALLKRAVRRPNQPPALLPVTANHVTVILLTSNLIGILFARSLHYQFYSWYALQIPFLAWQTPYPIPAKLAISAAIEYAWNVFPSTRLSSGILLGANVVLLGGLWLSPGAGYALRQKTN